MIHDAVDYFLQLVQPIIYILYCDLEINFHVVEAFSSEYAYLYFIASLSNLTRLVKKAPLLPLLLT